MPATRTFDRGPSAGQVAWITYAVTVAAIAVRGISFERTDLVVSFLSFHDSARAWWVGTPIYETAFPWANLNPPMFVFLTSPLGLLPVAPAFVIWTLIGLGAVIASLAIVSRHARLTAREWIWWVGAFVGLMPALFVWVEGQVTWVLLYFVTRSWATASSSETRAGWWLAPAIALKPPLALMALVLPWRVVATAAIGAVVVTILGTVVTGPGPWFEWIGLSSKISWIGWPMAVSLWGLAARAYSGAVDGVALQDLPLLLIVITFVAGVVLVAHARRQRGDERWVVAVLLSVLLSPAGWLYYLPLAAAPMMRSWRASPATVTAVVLLAIPMPLLGAIARSTPIPDVLLGSTYTAAVFLLWWAWTRPSVTP